MKKKLSTLLAALMVLTMAFAIAGCGSKPTLEDWYNKNADQFQEITDAVNSQDMGCTMEIVVEDTNALVFRYTLDEAFPTDADSIATLADVYDSMFDSYASTFSELRGEVLDETSTENVIIRLVALNPDGTELYSRDFTE